MRVCPSCGASEKQKRFAGVFCVDCFARQELFALKDFSLQLCPTCGRVRRQSEWVQPSQGVFHEILMHKIKSARDFTLAAGFSVGKKFLVVDAEIIFSVDGARVSQKRVFEIPLEKKLCLECGRLAGQYHEAIIQIRGEPARKEKTLARLTKLLAGSIAKVEEKKEGVNLLVLTKQQAFAALSSLGLRYSLAHKLVGVKQGKRVYKTTILIRV